MIVRSSETPKPANSFERIERRMLRASVRVLTPELLKRNLALTHMGAVVIQPGEDGASPGRLNGQRVSVNWPTSCSRVLAVEASSWAEAAISWVEADVCSVLAETCSLEAEDSSATAATSAM